MVAAGRSVARLADSGEMPGVARIAIRLCGSLALIGKGHASDRAILPELAGQRPP